MLALHPWHQKATLRVSEKVLTKANLPSIKSVLSQVQLRWIGHLARLEDIHTQKAVLLSEIQEGKRDRHFFLFRFHKHS